MDRRNMMISGLAALGAGSIAISCAPAPERRSEMPRESEPHARTLMQWPVSVETYGRQDLARVQAAIVRIANAIASFESVALLAAPNALGLDRKAFVNTVEHWDIPTDDLWCRDSGPTFVRAEDGSLAIAHIQFNGWGNKQLHTNDALIAQRVAKRLGLPLIPTGLMGEQGGIEHDGAGTMLAHASCWVNSNRNPGLTEDAIASRLGAALGARKMIWAPGVKGADITDYHIDSLARFTGPGRVLIQIDDEIDESDPWSVAAHATLDVLEQAKDANGRKLEIARIGEPHTIRSTKTDFVSSYINYYVCNGAVIAPQFGDSQADQAARERISAHYPGREIVMLDIDAIGESGGGIHCATQQQPRA
jgi:agmatine deiminase